MARANAAYYADRDPFADFTTAPEISQIFGEIIGAWAAVVWEMLGRPNPVILAEVGPGRGTLMADARRLTARVAAEFHAASALHFIETSPRLRGEQARRLPAAQWHDDLSTVPAGPMILIANEFLDALPIRQFRHEGEAWSERFVADGAFVELPCDAPPHLDGEGILEVNETSDRFAADLAARLVAEPGVALILDYGSAENPGDSLQAIRSARPADPLQAAGQADLTALVDFGAVGRAAASAGAGVQGPISQGVFLQRLGIFQRAERLGLGRSAEDAAGLMAGARRLVEPLAMGALFKAMAITPPSFPSLPGFAA
ncbi:SAM-dependent methyltransferase [Acidisoma cladoniae]|jgi:NADH dehydrogenase [ubiquinone] 1 alpha subcomplex assembly factor 7|uniref:SAM-dependent methyltransferase n=1 Tax=Acidisoma cladoniae TaxID=3040935 RepID=UPI00254D3501|nr:SAM-dependent methyltransferase [Acidisoma sp. PAMC 29798]